MSIEGQIKKALNRAGLMPQKNVIPRPPPTADEEFTQRLRDEARMVKHKIEREITKFDKYCETCNRMSGHEQIVYAGRKTVTCKSCGRQDAQS